MERRTFIGASAATLCSAAGGSSADPAPGTPELYELRTYTLKPAKQPALDEYLGKAYLPALKRVGVGPAGVFAGPAENDLLKVYVLVVHTAALAKGRHRIFARLSHCTHSRAACGDTRADSADPGYFFSRVKPAASFPCGCTRTPRHRGG
jgi:hypothetical protein